MGTNDSHNSGLCTIYRLRSTLRRSLHVLRSAQDDTFWGSMDRQKRPVRRRVFYRLLLHCCLDDLQDLIGGIDGAGDQLLGANRCAQTAGSTLAIVDDSQVVFHLDGLVGADLGAKAAADAALGTATDGNRALSVGIAGHDYAGAVVHRNDQVSGADRRAGHAAHTNVRIYLGHAVDHMDGIVLTSLDTAAEAQTAELTSHRAVAGHFGSRHLMVLPMITSPLGLPSAPTVR